MTKHMLGEVAYLVKDDGTISRTMVDELRADGSYGLLNAGYGKEFFDFAEAAKEAAVVLNGRKTKLQTDLADIESLLGSNGTPAHLEVVNALPMILDGRAGFMANTEVRLPPIGEYFEPGTAVFCVLTPKTMYLLKEKYCPAPFFILEVEILEVYLHGQGVSYSTNFCGRAFPSSAFADLNAAKAELVKLFAEQTVGTLKLEDVRVVLKEEMTANSTSVAA